MRRSIIVATSENGVIGKDGQIPWKLPNDLKRFKQLTMGHVLVMGRKTYASIGQPLPGRNTVVVTRGETPIPYASLVTPRFFGDAVILADKLEQAHREHDADGLEPEVFVCGGGEIYRQALPFIDRVYRTIVEQHFDGDTTFVMDFAHFKRVEVEYVEGVGLPHRFEIWDRVQP